MAAVLNLRTLHVSPQYHVVFDDEFTTVSFLRTGDIPPHWTRLVQFYNESASDETYDLALSWIEDTDTYPAGGPSNEEVSDAPQADISIVTQSRAPTPDLVVGNTSPAEEVSVNCDIQSKEGVHNSSSEEVSTVDPKPYVIPDLKNLDVMTLRCSSRTPKPSAVVLENRRQENEAAHRKTKKKKSFYRLFTMFTLCTASVIASSLSTVLNSVLQRAPYHVENMIRSLPMYTLCTNNH